MLAKNRFLWEFGQNRVGGFDGRAKFAKQLCTVLIYFMFLYHTHNIYAYRAHFWGTGCILIPEPQGPFWTQI